MTTANGAGDDLVDLVGLELEAFSRLERSREPAAEILREAKDLTTNAVQDDLVDLVGIEPTTSSMPWKRAPSCATGPLIDCIAEDSSILAERVPIVNAWLA